MATTGRVIRAIHDFGAREARVDSVGIGAGVVDRLKEQHQPVVDSLPAFDGIMCPGYA